MYIITRTSFYFINRQREKEKEGGCGEEKRRQKYDGLPGGESNELKKRINKRKILRRIFSGLE
uniref:Candidate secreted effector n=1 Tax=Meloidogyne incognita TaxID=6306 RepID=A0A914LU19_MELIC